VIARLPRVIQGELHTLTIDSRVLRDNPLGDPWRRELPVYLPPGNSASGLPVILVLAGFSSVGASLLKGTPWEPSLLLRYERLLADGRAARAALVFPDAFTRWGGSQYMNSDGTGRYADYLLHELLPAVEQRFGVGGSRARRGIAGKSSGGFGALHLALESPQTFAAVASHSGDCAFELCFRPDFPKLLAQLDRHGSLEAFAAAFERAPRKTAALLGAMNMLAMSAVYSPDRAAPLGIALPFEPRTGRLRPEVWARWLEHDPVERVRKDGRRLADFALVYVDAGVRDEFHLQYGARQLVEALREQGVAVQHDEFDDGHMGTGYRYEVSLPLLTRALSL